MDYLALACVVAALAMVVVLLSRGNARQERLARDDLAGRLALAKSAADADLARFGEELKRLELDAGAEHDHDHAVAVSLHQRAGAALTEASRPAEMSAVTALLEEGRYLAARVAARAAGHPVPVRRPPCFFNPAHGPSAVNVTWAGRNVPACACDAARIGEGAEPNIRTVQRDERRVPYWEGGPTYAGWAAGYYESWRGSRLIADIVHSRA